MIKIVKDDHPTKPYTLSIICDGEEIMDSVHRYKTKKEADKDLKLAKRGMNEA